MKQQHHIPRNASGEIMYDDRFVEAWDADGVQVVFDSKLGLYYYGTMDGVEVWVDPIQHEREMNDTGD